LKQLAIAAIRFYQVYLSRLKPPTCRFRPTCSHYAIEALQRYGFVRGLYLALKRIARCNPFTPGGYDPLP